MRTLACLLLAVSSAHAETVTLTWVNATENTDGTPYTDADFTRIKYYPGTDAAYLASQTCNDGTIQCATVDHPGEELVLELPQAEWRFVAYHVSLAGEWSEASVSATWGAAEPEPTPELEPAPTPAATTVTSTRIEAAEWTCRDAMGAIISSHVRADKAQERCTNEALAQPGVSFEIRPSGYRIKAE